MINAIDIAKHDFIGEHNKWIIIIIIVIIKEGFIEEEYNYY